jgi:hypothetical protein
MQPRLWEDQYVATSPEKPGENPVYTRVEQYVYHSLDIGNDVISVQPGTRLKHEQNKLFNRTVWCVGVDCSERPRMSGVNRTQESERFGAA